MSVWSAPVKRFPSSPLPVEDQVFVEYQDTWAVLVAATPLVSSVRPVARPVLPVTLFQLPDATTPATSVAARAQPAPFGSSRAKAMEMVSVLVPAWATGTAANTARTATPAIRVGMRHFFIAILLSSTALRKPRNPNTGNVAHFAGLLLERSRSVGAPRP